jgi:hypothetical protein
MFHCGMTDVEFVALIAVLLFDASQFKGRCFI